jgi:iron(III) transport system substrate-binding protein
LNPKWKGKIVIAQDDSDTFTVMAQTFLGGFTKADKWLRRLAANDPQVIQGATQVTDLVAAGQDAVTLNARTMRFLSVKKQGAPVAWNLTKAVAQPALISILRGAPHPAAGKLFVRWLLSREGQTLMAAQGRVPGLPGIKYDHSLLAYGTRMVVVKPEMAKQYPRYQKEWNTVLGIK